MTIISVKATKCGPRCTRKEAADGFRTRVVVDDPVRRVPIFWGLDLLKMMGGFKPKTDSLILCWVPGPIRPDKRYIELSRLEPAGHWHGPDGRGLTAEQDDWLNRNFPNCDSVHMTHDTGE